MTVQKLLGNADWECVKDAPGSLASGFWAFVAWLGMSRRFGACGAFGALAWMLVSLSDQAPDCVHDARMVCCFLAREYAPT